MYIVYGSLACCVHRALFGRWPFFAAQSRSFFPRDVKVVSYTKYGAHTVHRNLAPPGNNEF